LTQAGRPDRQSHHRARAKPKGWPTAHVRSVTAHSDARVCYSITDAGRAWITENRGLIDALLGQLSHIGSRMERVRRAFRGEDADDDGCGTTAKLRNARSELRELLREKRHAVPEEQRRIAAILRKAATEIRGQ
jgi:DNA-binding PadR family transcriptional regulator